MIKKNLDNYDKIVKKFIATKTKIVFQSLLFH